MKALSKGLLDRVRRGPFSKWHGPKKLNESRVRKTRHAPPACLIDPLETTSKGCLVFAIQIKSSQVEALINPKLMFQRHSLASSHLPVLGEVRLLRLPCQMVGLHTPLVTTWLAGMASLAHGS